MSLSDDDARRVFLVIDSSAGSRLAVVAARGDGSGGWQLEVLAEHANDNPRAHAEHLTPMIRRALAQAGIALSELDAIIATSGPAPYTGLRAGLITARTLGYALGIAVHGVSALDVVGRQLLDMSAGRAVIAVLDAKRREVYAQLCQANGADDVRVLRGPVAAPASEVAQWGVPGAAAGASAGAAVAGGEAPGVGGIGAHLYPEAFAGLEIIDDMAVPAASACVRIVLARLARQSAGEEVDLSVEPRYLRRPDVQMPNTAKNRTTANTANTANPATTSSTPNTPAARA